MYHTPVLTSDVVKGLAVSPGKRYIDATYGGGGHTKAIRQRGGIVLGIDTDKDAIEESTRELRTQNSMTNWKLVQGNFRDIKEIAQKEGYDKVDGILFDLGVSSHQLDTAGRGFSYRFGDAPLDLRLNQTSGMTAGEYIQHASEDQLYDAIATFGEREDARSIARKIVKDRPKTTGELLHIVGKNAASQVFQVLRIVVNDEFGALKVGLGGAKDLLRPGGRLVVISFHSLEDRMVKQFMKSDGWKLITKKPVVANETEVYLNKRARSAKLRVAEKL